MIEDILTLLMPILLQAVLGFDNLLYVSLESKRAPAAKQRFVRTLGISLAIVFRIALLFVLFAVIDSFQGSLFGFPEGGWVEGSFNLHSIIVLLGGVFILYTATKEIFHMIAQPDLGATGKKPKSVGSVIFWIVMMNLIFSFDSILSAMALTSVKWVMVTAILISGALMILLADTVSQFLAKNRLYEVLGLFILFIVGIMLLTEGGHLAHLRFFGNEITPMTKTTFYFVIGVLVLTDIVQGRYQKRLLAQRQQKAAIGGAGEPA